MEIYILYHRTKEPSYVSGHKKVDSTLIHIKLARALYKIASDMFNVKVAESKDEIVRLLAFNMSVKKID